MFKISNCLFIYTETPLHPGSGTSLGYVDLPVQREKHTGFPMIQASGIKGALREEMEESPEDRKKVEVIFGKWESSNTASCVSFSDGRLLLFPVPSFRSVFAWATCPFLLKRFERDMEWAGKKIEMNVPEIKEAEAVVSPDSILCVDDKVVLGEYTFNVKHDASLGDIAKNFSPALPPSLADDLVKRIVLLPDDTMRDFTRLFTEVITRIRINKETKTVNTGGLWTEEYIPPETLFYSVVLIHAPYAKDEELENEEEVRNFLEERISSRTFYRLGGNETVGKGIVRITFQGVKNGN